jgi:hypothetical protein
LVLLAVVCATAALKHLGYSELPDGRGGTNVEAVAYTPEMGFDKKRSLKAFQETLYPLLRAKCAACHSTENRTGTGAQAPLHADVDVNLAHEYALTRVNFRDPENSKLVVRMGVDRHNCFDGSCATASKEMLAAVIAWRNAVAGMIPEVPRGVPQSTKISDQQVLEWIKADQGAWNQRRVDAFTQIVRDPRLQRYVADKTINKLTGHWLLRSCRGSSIEQCEFLYGLPHRWAEPRQ